MTAGRLGALAGAICIPLVATAVAQPTARAQPIQLAQKALTEEEKKKLEQERKKGLPPKVQPPKGPPPPKAPPPPRKPPPPPVKTELPPPVKKLPPPVKQDLPPPEKKTFVPPVGPKGVGTTPDGKKDFPGKDFQKKNFTKDPVSPGKSPVVSPKTNGAPSAIVGTPPLQSDRSARKDGKTPSFGELKKDRKQHTEDGGKRTVTREGNRTFVKQGNTTIILHDDSDRFRRLHRNARTERRADGHSETFYVRSDGVRVVSVVDSHGRLVRRYRRDRDGREFNIIDSRRFWRNTGIAVGVGALGLAIALNLPPPRVRIPREQYIVDYDRASDDDLYVTLSAPPVDELERAYSLEEIRYNYELRQRMRRVDLDTITFEFGSWEVGPHQYRKLERIARVMQRLLERNPDEVFLIAAHTDRVGAEVDNLSLSDRRAEAVAQILSEEFAVPAENLVTQGYGEQYPKIDTFGPEPGNRRVEVQRITPLMAERR